MKKSIYKNKYRFKVFIFIIALAIGYASLYYTDIIVAKLIEREKNQIELYAKALKSSVDPENNDALTFLFQEIIQSNNFIPVILTDLKGKIIAHRNINLPKEVKSTEREKILQKELALMKVEHAPISSEKSFIYYRNSYLISQLRYYPYAQLTAIAIFAFFAYSAFNYSRKAEQNRVWVGLAKETAHQLGTPLSSLMAWIEYFKSDPTMMNQEFIPELEKDIKRLETITTRFSNIGSVPILKEELLIQVIEENMAYLQKRISSKVKITIQNNAQKAYIKLNRYLFEWVIENISKNAVDAMSGGVGELKIIILDLNKQQIAIDISDTGKGMSKNQMNRVFEPGFTTKKRGWGLGLALAKRIIEDYHQGKIFVKSSEVGKGTVFRIILNN